MYVERVLYPVETLGIGKRLAIWLQGCSHCCDKCINPELWEVKEKNNIDIGKFTNIIDNCITANSIKGITITGGDPFYQVQELYILLQAVKKRNVETLVYTGFLYRELFQDKEKAAVLKFIDVLIDGPYIEEKNDNLSALRGSVNQNIYYSSPLVERRYKTYLREGRKIQNIYFKDYLLSIGIHDRGYQEE